MIADLIIIGAGVIGQSLALLAARAGLAVTVLDRREPGRESSWAGAGMIPTAMSEYTADDPVQLLLSRSRLLHAQWHLQLRELTGIDNQYEQSGAWYSASTPEEAADLAKLQSIWRLIKQPPSTDSPPRSFYLPAAGWLFQPGDARARNPRHIQALHAACRATGVCFETEAEVQSWQIAGERVIGVRTERQTYHGERFCCCAGAWSGRLLAAGIVPIPIRPIRGQIVLLRTQPGTLVPTVNVGNRYLVPRQDGLVLVGSTEEDVGYDQRTTDERLNELEAFAKKTIAALADAPRVTAWAGLRPYSETGRPWIGRIAQFENLWIAAGHHRHGLALSPATAELLLQLIQNQPTTVEWQV